MTNKLSVKGNYNTTIQSGSGNNEAEIKGSGNISKQTSLSAKEGKGKNTNWTKCNFFLNILNTIKNFGFFKWIAGLF